MFVVFLLCCKLFVSSSCVTHNFRFYLVCNFPTSCLTDKFVFPRVLRIDVFGSSCLTNISVPLVLQLKINRKIHPSIAFSLFSLGYPRRGWLCSNRPHMTRGRRNGEASTVLRSSGGLTLSRRPLSAMMKSRGVAGGGLFACSDGSETQGTSKDAVTSKKKDGAPRCSARVRS